MVEARERREKTSSFTHDDDDQNDGRFFFFFSRLEAGGYINVRNLIKPMAKNKTSKETIPKTSGGHVFNSQSTVRIIIVPKKYMYLCVIIK